MTTIELTGLHMAPVSDLSDLVVVKVRPYQEDIQTPDDIRRYSGGRDRIIGGAGQSRGIAFTAVQVDRATFETMVDRLGVLQLFRDSRGRALYGMTAAMSAMEWRADPDSLETISFTVRSVTYSEVV